MTKGKPRNLALEEAELNKIEDLNRRKKKALAEQAELMRAENELEGAEAPPEGTPGETAYISEKLASVIEELNDDGKFWVYRLEESGRKFQVGAYPVADWPTRMEEIAHQAGGGTFQVVFKRNNGQNVGQTTQTFDPIFYKRKDVAAPGGDLAALLMAQSQEARREAAEARAQMMELMKTVMTAMSQPRDAGIFKSAQDIAAVGALFKGNSSDPIAVLKTGIELGMQMGEGKEAPSTMDKILETIAAPAAGLLERMNRAPAARPAAMPKPVTDPPALPPPAPEPVPVVEPSETELVKMNPFYKTYVPKILGAARKGEDAREWAEYITDMIPALYHPALLEILQKPDLVDYLGTFEPEARNLAAWITSVRNEINALFPPEEIPAGRGVIAMTPAPLKADGTIDGVVPQVVLDALNE